MEDNLVNVEEAKKILGGIHIMTVYRMASTGEIPSIKLGHRVMFKKSDLIAWINNHAKVNVENKPDITSSRKNTQNGN